MTTNVTTDWTFATANGTTPIPFTFQALSKEEIGVQRNGDELVYLTDFTVTLNGDDTGTITPLSSWGTDSITIYSKPAFNQPANFTRFAAFFPDQFVPPLDRLARYIINLLWRIIGLETQIDNIPSGPAGSLEVSGMEFRTPQQHFAEGDDIADDASAFGGLITAMKTTAITGHQYGNAGGKAYVPKPAVAYRVGSTIDIDISARLEAEGTGYVPGSWSTIVHGDPGVTIFRIQSWNTFGASGDDAGDLFTGTGAMLIGFAALGQYNGTTHLEGPAHGYHLRGTGTLRDGAAMDMQGDGIYIHAGVATAGAIGNANAWEVSRFFIQNCTNGISTSLSDSNAGMATMVVVSGCREWGAKNESGAGNIFLGCLFQLCGVFGDGTANKPAATCHRTGHHYAVRKGQESWCSANPPSGDTSSNTGWIHFEAGGIVNPGFVDWFNGMVCRAGGPFYFGTSALGIGLYFEGSQPPPQISGDSILLGGTWGGPIIGGATISANSNQLLVNALRITAGGISTDDDIGGSLLLGRNGPGNPAVLRATSSSPYLALCGPDGSQNVNVYSDQVHLLQFSGGGYFANTTNFAPLVDDANDLGRVDKRWNDVFATNNVIQTSDRQLKTQIRKLNSKQFEALLDAVGAVPVVAYKLRSAVKAKGKKARDHYGIIAQDLYRELVKRGLDPFAGGVLGRDPVLEEIEEEVEVEREAQRTEYQYVDRYEIVDGKAIKRQELVELKLPDFEEVPVHDEDGNPVIIPATPPSVRKAIVDGEVVEIEVPGAPERQEMHKVRRMERITEKRIIRKPKLDKRDKPVMIWNVRYAELAALQFAWVQREMRKTRK